ncbi:exoribonuclease II [Thorsellia kenyensis]|uniref:Exoribonuclease II n=1 Tax=Thorsellia kenyensis TaxID=1549888 RepID=A0ABV6C7J0_9GAMM
MFQNNPLLAQLKQQLHVSTPMVEGIVKSTSKAFGFLEVDAQTSYFIPPPQMKKVLHGDKVSAKIETENGKEFAKLEALIQPSLTRFIARVQFENQRLAIIPDHPQLNTPINAKLALTGKNSFEMACHEKSIDPTKTQLKNGDWVVATLVGHPLGLIYDSDSPAQNKNKQLFFFAEITEFITFSDDPLAPWWVTLAEQDLPRTAPILPDDIHSLLSEERSLDALLNNGQFEDLSNDCFFTIDSESTVDMDDALFVTNVDNILKLTVAIANPTEFIPSGSAIDEIAKQRGFTCYLPGFNVPMLPRELSDNLCSLIPNKMRRVLACEMSIDESGDITDYRFFNAVIESKHKLSYTNVSDYLEMQGDWKPSNLVLQKQISQLAEFAKRRQAWREKNALIFNDKPEYKFILGDDGTVLSIEIDERRIANKMVEESMLAANLCGADFLESKLGYGLFNVHEGFDKEHIEAAVKTLANYNITCECDSLLTLNGFCDLKRKLALEPTEFIDSRLRRFQTMAEIRLQPGPHFGLGFKGYATWTSPIRKYSDIINHRLIKSILAQEKPDAIEESLCDHLMIRRKISRQAERFIANWLYAIYLEPFAGKDELFKGEIIDINRAGMRVKLIDNGAVGFIPNSFLHSNRDEIASLVEDGYIEIKGEKVFTSGQSIEVKIHEVRKETRSIIFSTQTKFS